MDRYRVERPDGQPVRDPRVREGWVERRYLRTEQSVTDENARIQRDQEERRAAEQQAEQQREQQERQIQQAPTDAWGWRDSLNPRKLCRQLRDSMRRNGR